MPLKLNSTGGGSVTLDAGVTASNYTVTLPATSGTLLPIATVTNNGVVYINSSGAATSGSGLVFDSSGNLGVGTASPGNKLEVNGAIRSKSSTGGTLNLDGTIAGTTNTLGSYTNNGASFADLYLSANQHLFYAAGSERMRLDTAGNLGLGVAPSAWGSFWKAIESATASGFAITNANTNPVTIGSNFYSVNSGFTSYYKTTGAASKYDCGNGVHLWQTAPSGTAGNAITFTTAMVMDANGNLGLGTSTPSTGTLNTQLTINSGAGTYAGVVIQNSATGSSYNDGMALYIAGATGGTIMLYEAAPLTFGTSALERMRIDANGKVLINTTANPLAATINIAQPNNASWALSYQLGNTALGTVYTNTSGTAQYTALGFYNNGGTYSSCGQVVVSGTSTAYNTSSDYRLKENIKPMQNALARNAQLKPVTYQWKADGSTGEGFIAHELQEIVPDAVTGEKDAVDKEGNPVYQGVDTSFLVGHLVACINELKAELDELKAKVQ